MYSFPTSINISKESFKALTGKWKVFWKKKMVLEKLDLSMEKAEYLPYTPQKLTQMDNRRKHEGLILLEENDSRKISCDLG